MKDWRDDPDWKRADDAAGAALLIGLAAMLAVIGILVAAWLWW